jgi:hypothetical protein
MTALMGRDPMKPGLSSLDRGAGELEDDGQFNKTKSIINNLVLDKVIQTRTMHIAFGSISLALAILVIFRIWYDSWRASKLQIKLRPRFVAVILQLERFHAHICRKWAFLYDLHPAESFPLILGFIILIQQMSFVTIQSTALKSVFIPRCRIASQIVLTRKSSRGCIRFQS